ENPGKPGLKPGPAQGDFFQPPSSGELVREVASGERASVRGFRELVWLARLLGPKFRGDAASEETDGTTGSPYKVSSFGSRLAGGEAASRLPRVDGGDNGLCDSCSCSIAGTSTAPRGAPSPVGRFGIST